MTCNGETPTGPCIAEVEIVGKAVRLRPLSPGDAALAYPLLQDDAVLRWLCWEGPESQGEIEEKYRGWREELRLGRRFPLAIEGTDNPGILGSIEAQRGHESGQFILGYWLVPLTGDTATQRRPSA